MKVVVEYVDQTGRPGSDSRECATVKDKNKFLREIRSQGNYIKDVFS